MSPLKLQSRRQILQKQPRLRLGYIEAHMCPNNDLNQCGIMTMVGILMKDEIESTDHSLNEQYNTQQQYNRSQLLGVLNIFYAGLHQQTLICRPINNKSMGVQIPASQFA